MLNSGFIFWRVICCKKCGIVNLIRLKIIKNFNWILNLKNPLKHWKLTFELSTRINRGFIFVCGGKSPRNERFQIFPPVTGVLLHLRCSNGRQNGGFVCKLLSGFCFAQFQAIWVLLFLWIYVMFLNACTFIVFPIKTTKIEKFVIFQY